VLYVGNRELSRSATEDCKLGKHKTRLGTDVRRDWNVEYAHRQKRLETPETCADVYPMISRIKLRAVDH
jgi:hypothetical protein